MPDYPRGWASLDDGAAVDLRALDGSLAVDAGNLALDAASEAISGLRAAVLEAAGVLGVMLDTQRGPATVDGCRQLAARVLGLLYGIGAPDYGVDVV